MNFVESLSMFHVDAKEIPCVTEKGAPTEKTLGAPGVLYMDTDTGDLYKCRAADAVNKVYNWEKIGGGSSDYKLPIGGEQLGGVKNGGNVVINEDGTMTAPGSGSSQNGDGLTSTEKSLILSLFKNAAYTADMSATIAQLETLWSGGTVEPEPEEPDEPVNPDVWYEHFNENNLVDTAGQNSFVTVDDVRYYRYHAGANNFEYPMTNQQPGEVIVKLRAIPQYATSLDSGIWLNYSDGTKYKIQVIQGGQSNGTITYTTPSDKTLVSLTGNYDMEGWVLLDMSVMSIQAKYPPAESEGSGVWQAGNTLSVVSGVTATQNGSVLAIA